MTTTPETAETVLPCPFCGSSASFGSLREEEDNRYRRMSLSCDDCDATITECLGWGTFKNMAETEIRASLKAFLTTAWNRRTIPEAALRALILEWREKSSYGGEDWINIARAEGRDDGYDGAADDLEELLKAE